MDSAASPPMGDVLHEARRDLASAGMPGPAGVHHADVVVVGAGLSGAVAAVTLGRAGYRVALVDRQAVCPPQFRVEKFGGDQAAALRRLGLLDAIAAEATPFDAVVNCRNGRIIDHTHVAYWSIRYENAVRIVRDELPATGKFLVDEVIDIVTTPEGQRVMLASGETVEARLVVVATGMSEALWQKLGMTRRTTFAKHSISFGFDVTPASGRPFRNPAITYYGAGPADKIDYLTLFPLGDVTRANLFTFLDDKAPWIRELRREPKQALLRALPGLATILGDFEVSSGVQGWVMNLCEVEPSERDGLVIIGDAFRTSCPAAGIGVSRLLADVERLCVVYAPRWLASPGMGREKIREFYRDGAKQTSDRRALRASHNRRSRTLGASLYWRVRQRQHFLRRRLTEWLRADR